MKKLPALNSIVRPVEEGMNLRDYFAGQVIAGLAADPNYRLDEDGADMAYKVADMMIKRREK